MTSSTAMKFIAGWSLPGVQTTYLRYEVPGDRYVERTVTGLPIVSDDFSVNPPHFVPKDDVIENALFLLFPGFPTNLIFVAEHSNSQDEF